MTRKSRFTWLVLRRAWVVWSQLFLFLFKISSRNFWLRKFFGPCGPRRVRFRVSALPHRLFRGLTPRKHLDPEPAKTYGFRWNPNPAGRNWMVGKNLLSVQPENPSEGGGAGLTDGEMLGTFIAKYTCKLVNINATCK